MGYTVSHRCPARKSSSIFLLKKQTCARDKSEDFSGLSPCVATPGLGVEKHPTRKDVPRTTAGKKQHSDSKRACVALLAKCGATGWTPGLMATLQGVTFSLHDFANCYIAKAKRQQGRTRTGNNYRRVKSM